MNALAPLILTAADLTKIRSEFSSLADEITPFLDSPKLAGLAASIGIQREVGGVNDETARFLFASETGAVVPLDSLHAELVTWNNVVGVRIYSTASDRLEFRARSLRQLLHPDFSFNDDGTIRQLVVFPEIIADIVRLEGVELVLVRSWGMNSIFGGFDPSKGYYQTNFWELENNDALLFSKMLQAGQIAMLGTHDLVAHVAGIRADAWTRIRPLARRVHESIKSYMPKTFRPDIASLVLPYTLGVVLDDLVQPPSYDSPSHLKVIETLLEALGDARLQRDRPTLMTRYPKQFEAIIKLSRTAGVEANATMVQQQVGLLVDEIIAHSA